MYRVFHSVVSNASVSRMTNACDWKEILNFWCLDFANFTLHSGQFCVGKTG